MALSGGISCQPTISRASSIKRSVVTAAMPNPHFSVVIGDAVRTPLFVQLAASVMRAVTRLLPRPGVQQKTEPRGEHRRCSGPCPPPARVPLALQRPQRAAGSPAARWFDPPTHESETAGAERYGPRRAAVPPRGSDNLRARPSGDQPGKQTVLLAAAPRA